MLEPDELDVLQARALFAEAQRYKTDAYTKLEQAHALWRGPGTGRTH
ncbi:hypothetical protein OG921_18985 [Aldersonia sp. NBC_00410]|nr:hypothetical protein [Aldersonia sp. NBC_00410]MCX5045256.1 hypothetical protein [Aldersonia sp. NBC_00410]